MDTTTALKREIKGMMVENLMLQVTQDEIGDDLPLFGPDSLGLDSVDALQMVVALDKNYGLKFQIRKQPVKSSKRLIPSPKPWKPIKKPQRSESKPFQFRSKVNKTMQPCIKIGDKPN